MSNNIVAYARYYKTCILFVVFKFNTKVTDFTTEKLLMEYLKKYNYSFKNACVQIKCHSLTIHAIEV